MPKALSAGGREVAAEILVGGPKKFQAQITARTRSKCFTQQSTSL